MLNVPVLVLSKLQVGEVPEQGGEAAVYKEDLVQLLDEGEEEKHVADGIVVNVDGGTFHSENQGRGGLGASAEEP